MTKIKINISEVGHDVNHPSPQKLLKHIFIKLGYDVVSSEHPLEHHINFIFEGYSNYKIDEINRFLQKKKNYFFGIIFTEYLSAEANLNAKYFSINNFFLTKNKFKNRILLIILHYIYKIKLLFFYFYKFLERIGNNNIFFIKLLILPFSRISRLICESLYFANSKISNNRINNFFYWGSMFKSIYMDTYKNFKRFDLAISVGLDNNYEYLIKQKLIKNYHFLPFIGAPEDLKELNLDNLNKKYDVMFTGRITSRRNEILNQIKKNLKSRNLYFKDTLPSVSEWREVQAQSRLILSIDQYENQKFVSVAKIYEGLKLGIPTLVECNNVINPEYISEFCFITNKNNITQDIEHILNNYTFYYEKFLKMRKLFFNSFSEAETKKFSIFLENTIKQINKTPYDKT